LPLRQEQIPLDGHAIEARLYAENPETGFLPSTGPLTHFLLPQTGVRVDSAVEQGGEVTAFYDPMIAKLIAHASTRAAAARQLEAACAAVQVWPVKTNAAFLARSLRHPAFLGAALDTGFIAAHLPDLLGGATPDAKVLRAAALARLAGLTAPPALRGFRLNAPPCLAVRLRHDQETYVITPPPGAKTMLPAVVLGEEIVVFAQGQAFAFDEISADTASHGGGESDGAVLSPMPGHILSVVVAKGDKVKKGAPLLMMEAMKMEMTLAAPCDGVVAELHAAPGVRVAEGVLLLRLEPGE
jgi:acetyl/propionyl-CoA carboxylase alpha subunit